MLDQAVQGVRLRDLPVCVPMRACVEESPYGADLMNLTSALTPVSAAIAATCWAVIGFSFVLIVLGLRLQWQGHGVRPWALVLPIVLVIGGIITVWSTGAWTAEVVSVYGGADGRPPAPVPSDLIDSWPLVEAAGVVAIILGALALFALLNTAAIHEGRARRAHVR